VRNTIRTVSISIELHLNFVIIEINDSMSKVIVGIDYHIYHVST